MLRRIATYRLPTRHTSVQHSMESIGSYLDVLAFLQLLHLQQIQPYQPSHVANGLC